MSTLKASKGEQSRKNNLMLNKSQENNDLRSSCYPGTNMSDVIWKKFSQPKISNFRVKVFVKKYVTRFDVSMNDTRNKFFMKESKTPCYTHANSRSFAPVQ